MVVPLRIGSLSFFCCCSKFVIESSNLYFFTICMYKHCFLPLLLVFEVKFVKMHCSLPHNPYCYFPWLLHLLVCICINFSSILCPPSLVLCWCLLCFLFCFVYISLFFFKFFVAYLLLYFLTLDTAHIQVYLCVQSEMDWIIQKTGWEIIQMNIYEWP